MPGARRCAHTPAALTTTRARRVTASELSTIACTSEPSTAVTDAPVRIRAPYAAAVRAIATTSRASSTSCPSQKTTPPPPGRTPGVSRATSSAVTRRVEGSEPRPPGTEYRTASPRCPPAAASTVTSRPAASGTRKGSFRTRCGAVVPMRTARSRALSRASPISPCARYRRPPCTSFDDHRLVPAARSARSSSTTDRPRLAASSATPAPVTPPPTTTTSTSAPARPARSRRTSRRGERPGKGGGHCDRSDGGTGRL